MTTALVILGLDGKIISHASSRDFDFSRIAGFVSGKCIPIMIASDVSRASGLARRLASAFSVPSWSPRITPDRRQKSLCSIPYRHIIKDSHSQDALAAAMLALKENGTLFRTVESRMRKRDLLGKVDPGGIIRDVLTGRAGNIGRAFDSRLSEEKPGPDDSPRRKASAYIEPRMEKGIACKSDLVISLEERNTCLEKENRKLLQKLAEERASVRSRIERGLGREAALARSIAERSRNESERHRKASESYEKLLRLLSRGWMLSVFTESCEKSIMVALDRKGLLEGSWLFIGADSKTSGIGMMKKAQGVFCPEKFVKPIRSSGLTAIDYSKLEFYRVNDFVAVKIGIGEIEKERKEQFSSWLKEYKNRTI